MGKSRQKPKDALWADVPVGCAADDQLGRASFAATLAKTIRSMKGSDSFVFGICGPWGSGKSSVLRMTVNELESGKSKFKPIVITFNPWWFSGQEQLLASFLGQLAAAIGKADSGKRVTKLGKRLETFATVLRPFTWIPGAEPLKQVGEVLSSGAQAAESLGERLATDVHHLREQIDDALRASKRRIVIVMDDIDRLTATEISQLFVIVKAVADFPNTVYLLSFDHAVVCQAIKNKLGLDGAAYLEKIVQIRVDVPPASPVMLQEMFVGQLDKLIPSEFTTQASLKDFGNYLHGGIKTFLKTPRSVKSLTNVLRVLFPAVSGEVYWPDFVAITALQVFAPDVYGVIRDNPDQFAWYASNVVGHDDDRETRKKFEDALLERVPPENKSAVSELVNRLFPNTGSGYGRGSYGSDWSARWQAELRICSPECFDRYFQFRVPSGEFSEAEWREVLSQLDQPAAVDDKIRAVCAQHGANRRTSRAKEFLEKASLFATHGATPEQVTALLDAIIRNGDAFIANEDEDRSPGIPIRNDMRLMWAVQDLLDRLASDAEREAMVERLLPSAGLNTATKLVWLFGAQHGLFGSESDEPKHVQHVSVECVERLKSITLSKLQAAAADGSLAADPRALKLAREWRSFNDNGDAQKWVTEAGRDDQTLVRMMLGVQSSTSSHGMSDHVATIGKYAGSDFLVGWFDGKELRQRCQAILDENEAWLTPEIRAGVQLVIDSIDEHGKPLDPFRLRRELKEQALYPEVKQPNENQDKDSKEEQETD